ncbi:hypothetical protein ACQR3P_29435 [Rhodococcus sp. IEGM1300]
MNKTTDRTGETSFDFLMERGLTVEGSWKDYEKERYEALVSGLEHKKEQGKVDMGRSFTTPTIEDVIESEQFRETSGHVEQDLMRIIANMERVLNPRIDATGQVSLSEMTEMSRQLDAIERDVDRMAIISGRSRKAVAEDHAPEWKMQDMAPGELAFERETKRLMPLVNEDGGWMIPSTDSPNVADIRNGATIKVTRRVGLSSQAQRLPIENVIDGSRSSYWEETILTDEPIARNGGGGWEESYEGIPEEGAFLELEIRFRGVSYVSEVDVRPFCRFPVEVVSIVGLKDKGETVLVTQEEAKSSNERMTFRFPGETLVGVRLLVRQRNAEEAHYWVSTDDMKENAVWEHQASVALPTSESLTIGADAGMTGNVSKWHSYLKRLETLAEESGDGRLLEEANLALELASIGDYDKAKTLYAKYVEQGESDTESRLDTKWTAHTKIAYRYGFYSIEVRGSRHLRRGVAVSKPYALPATARDIVLDTEEEHMHRPENKSIRGTAVEWYVSNSPSPQGDEWHAILPQKETHVLQEQLVGGLLKPVFPYDGRYLFFRLRFEVQDGLTLYRDGKTMERSQYGMADDMKTVALLRDVYSPTSVYTVYYRPSPSARVVRLSEVGEEIPHVDASGSAGERMTGIPARRAHTLQAAPVKESVKVWVDEEEWSLTEAKPLAKEYRLNGSTIEFGEGEGMVRIDYDRFATTVRVKAVLRQHQGGESGETPTVRSYTLYAANEKETEHGQIQGAFNAPY